MTQDKTGAETTVTAGKNQFTVEVDGRQVGVADYVDHDGQRIFHHTEVDNAFEGRGLASIMVGESLAATRDAGLRIVAVCPMVAKYIEKHPEFQNVADPVSADTERYLQQVLSS
ncbi:GNAT family N-acetyltransferase [Mycolicibacterium rhodesiae]|uniref:GNAT family N-acetyltransferase n=1 Tax=Mycolicibacterium rhodesiae TaxID=36814 RepID=A0A1X0J2C2_MYCRH|nr:GNAT family N-acetyltransferase [Mycolicibacterium rhodesiae]MCV7344522.1 N-acetyltransferase [Mycolicibacterium rhodesiae]ORB55981.1 GNAT family N-acetyltransferase [Mycolicibacterium rhodesiae]